MSRREIGPHDRPLWGTIDPDVADQRETWLADAVDAIGRLAAAMPTVTADDLRPIVPEPPSPAWWGRAWATARRRGVVRRTGGYRASATPSRRHGAIAVWRRGGGAA